MPITTKYYLGQNPSDPMSPFDIPMKWVGNGDVPATIIAYEISEGTYNGLVAAIAAAKVVPPIGGGTERDEIDTLQTQMADVLARIAAMEICLADCLNGSGSGSE